MTDTQRSRSALQALFADNTSGDISPQDLRDFLASTKLYMENRFVTVYDEATVSIDCNSGNHFYLEASGNRTIGAPTNASSRLSDKMIIRIKAQGANRTITFTSTIPSGYRFGTDISAISGVTTEKTDYYGFIYNANSGVWDMVAYVRGY